MTKALIFDVFQTLLRFKDDEAPEHPWDVLADYLRNEGATADAATVRQIRTSLVDQHFATAASAHPDVDMREVYRELVDAVLPGRANRDDIAEEAAWRFRLAATEYCTVFPGTHEAISALRSRFRVAIASNTQRVYTERELEAAALGELFEVVVFSSDVGRVKPHPLLLEHTLEALAVDPHDVLYIGDNPLDDYVAATAAGIPIVLIRHDGITDRAELGVPHDIPVVTGFASLVELLTADAP